MTKSKFETQFSPLGFGCWQIGGASSIDGRPNGWGTVEEQDALEALEQAVESGINFFDTAPGYGEGRSESILGKAFEGHRSKVVICTKAGSKVINGKSVVDYSPEFIRDSLYESLERLRTDFVDFLLLHNPPDDFDYKNYDTTILDQLIEEGRIGKYGVSCKSVYGAEHVLASNFGTAIEAVYNPLDRRLVEDVLTPSKHDYFVIARVPLASGFLTQKVLKSRQVFAASDWRFNMSKSQSDWMIGCVNKLSFLNDLSGGITTSALRFQLASEAVDVSIPGIRNKRHLQSVQEALEYGPLSETEMTKIRELIPTTNPAWIR